MVKRYTGSSRRRKTAPVHPIPKDSAQAKIQKEMAAKAFERWEEKVFPTMGQNTGIDDADT